MNLSDKSWVGSIKKWPTYRSGTIRSVVTKVKPQQPPEDKTGVIYSIPSLTVTKSTLVGQVYRTPSMRRSEHIWHLCNGKIDDPAVAPLVLTNLTTLTGRTASFLTMKLTYFQIIEILLIQRHNNPNQMLVWQWAQYGLHWHDFV